MLVKSSIHQEYVIVINISVHHQRAYKYMKPTLTDLNGGIHRSTVITENFNTPLSIMDRTTKEKFNKEKTDINNSINQLELTDIYRTLHPQAGEYTLFSSARGTFYSIDHIRGHKTSLITF